MQLWPHQERTLSQIEKLREGGIQRLCVQGPTGAGKTITFLELARRELERAGRVAVYTNRRTIRAQISQVFDANQMYHGVRAAGTQPQLCASVQVSSIMTERVRSLCPDPIWDLHQATLVIVDELHLNKAKTASRIIDEHIKQGAFVTGWTATPVSVGHVADAMVSMASLKELRAAGVLVPCDVYAPEEVDMRGIRTRGGEFIQAQAAKRVKQCIIVGQVLDHWERLNPEGKPTVMFAPGVKESRWFAEQFAWHGIAAEHIDARTSDKRRQEIFDRWMSGKTQIVCNFGVLAEGFDFKGCCHAILARPTGKVSTYLQMVGRILRAMEGKDHCVLQDHVGAYWRHGSPNEDRHWDLSTTDQSLYRERKKRDPKEHPALCPKCGAVRYPIKGFYDHCPKCGFTHKPVYRQVRQTDGKLVKVTSLVRELDTRDPIKVLQSCIYKAARSNMTAGQALGMFGSQTGRWIDPLESPWFIPHKVSEDWKRPASEVWPWAQQKRNP